MTTTFKENDILVCSGGWECTRVTFFKVIKVMNGFATFKVLNNKTVSFEPFAGTLGSGTVIPTDEFKIEDTIRKKIKYHEEEPYISLSTYESAWLWDGKPREFDFRNI